MDINNLNEAIELQVEVNKFLRSKGIKDLVGDYGELLIHKVLGGTRESAVNKGFDISHPKFNRIEVKTRKYELNQNGKTRKENRAVGFKGKENGFDWLAHIILDTDYSVISGCLCSYQDVWPEIQEKKGKVSFGVSSNCDSSIDLTEELQSAQRNVGNSINKGFVRNSNLDQNTLIKLC